MDSVTNGLTRGNFTLLQVLDPTTNQLVNMLTLINNATGGVQNAQAPLALNTGVLSIDLSAYSTTTDIQTLLSNYTDTAGLNTILAGYTNTTALNTLLTNYVLSTTLTSTLANYTDTTALNTLLGNYVLTTTLNNTLAKYTDTTALTTLLSHKQDNLSVTGQGVFLNGSVLSGYDLRWNTSNTPTALIHCLRFEDLSVVQNLNLTSGQLELQVSASNKQDNISATLPLTLSGSTIDTLWKPSTLTVGTGLLRVASDALGTCYLTLTGQESRTALKLADSSGTVRDLTSSTAGNLLWDSAQIDLVSDLSAKQDSLSVSLPLTLTGSNLDALWKPSHLTVSAGLGITSNDAT